jgi:hypothetical protein
MVACRWGGISTVFPLPVEILYLRIAAYKHDFLGKNSAAHGTAG